MSMSTIICNRWFAAMVLVALCFRPDAVLSLSMVTPTVKGSAAKPYEKKKVAVFGAGGYLGGCVYGFLQRAGSLYGTGISDIKGPRSLVATGPGSVALNGILGKNFILAQADESFVKLTDMTSADSIKEKIAGFDAVIIPTRYTFETRPVTLGTYEKSPNDKTLEFYMDSPRSVTIKGIDDKAYSMEVWQRTLDACSAESVKHIVVVETDGQFDDAQQAGKTYLDMLDACGVPYTYIRPQGKMENSKDYTFAKGVMGELNIAKLDANSNMGNPSGTTPIPREDVAALCVQSLLSFDWDMKNVISVECTGPASEVEDPLPPQREWCANSAYLATKLSPLV